MLDRHCPADTIPVVSMEQIMPVFLNIPGKGVLFEEDLAKTGASDDRSSTARSASSTATRPRTAS